MKAEGILDLEAIAAAPALLGWVLCRRLGNETLRARIVETEAYHQNDPASHSFRGLTPRTEPMFQSGGAIYVYFTYGMHYCLNIVTGQAGKGEAVLIRAAEPLEGIEAMRLNRGIEGLKKLTNGPGKLAQAFGIKDTKLSGQRLGAKTLWLESPARKLNKEEIIIDKRVGIRLAADVEARFYIKNNAFVSKIRPA